MSAGSRSSTFVAVTVAASMSSLKVTVKPAVVATPVAPLSGTLALDGAGLQMEQALRSARGRARIDVTDGTIAGLQLVRTIVTATSGRGGVLASAGAALAAGDTAGGERF